MGDPFLAFVGAFLILNGLMLYLMRNVMARTGVSGWAWLPKGSQFKTYKHQLLWSKVTAAIPVFAGLVFLGIFLWSR